MTAAKHPTHPCASCPYRLDAPLAHWHAEHFESTQASALDPTNGAIFACHSHIKLPPEERGMCAGWLLDQKTHGLPSLNLRLAFFKDATVAPALGAVHSTVPMFESALEMCSVNLRAIRSSRRPARRPVRRRP